MLLRTSFPMEGRTCSITRLRTSFECDQLLTAYTFVIVQTKCLINPGKMTDVRPRHHTKCDRNHLQILRSSSGRYILRHTLSSSNIGRIETNGLTRGFMRQSYKIARWIHGTRKWVPSGEAWIYETVELRTTLPLVTDLTLHTGEPIEHNCTVASRNVINASLHQSQAESSGN